MITKIQYTDQVNRQIILNANMDKTLTEEQNITEGNFLIFSDLRIEGTDLRQVQQDKISQITDLYNQKLEAGFTSTATGNVFGYGLTDQMKFMQLAILVLSNIAVFPLNIPAKDSKIISHTLAQYNQLVADIANFAQNQNAKEHGYINQINLCTTSDQVNAVVIAF